MDIGVGLLSAICPFLPQQSPSYENQKATCLLVIRSMLFDLVFWGIFFSCGSWAAYFLLYFHGPSALTAAHYFMHVLFTGEHKDEQISCAKK
jgi:hypothetical protein